MTKCFALILGLSVLVKPVLSQLRKDVVEQGDLNWAFNNADYVPEFDQLPRTVEGTNYLNEEWFKGDIYLKNTEVVLKGYPLRYNLDEQYLELNTKLGIKIVPLHLLSSFRVADGKRPRVNFVNCSNYQYLDGFTALNGIFEIIVGGEYQLLAYKQLKLIRANYAPTVDMGYKNDRWVVRERFYYVKEGLVYPMPQSKKEFLHTMNMEGLADFMRKNKHKLKEREDLVAIFEFMQ